MTRCLATREARLELERAAHLPRSSYRLTADLVSAHCGSLGVVALDARAIGQHFPLYPERPGAAYNALLRADGAPVQWGAAGPPKAERGAVVTRVEIRGPIAERAGYEEPCGAWVPGHDSIAESMIAALEEGDVLLVLASPGGVVAGGQEAMRAILDAKRRYGRRITGWVGELCGSMAAWYALALCDDLYLPKLGVMGSIGARGAHASIAVALEKEGIAWTYFSAPGEGKVALAPELPLSDLGRARAQRDVDDCYAAFEADVCAAPLGKALGLTPKLLRKLDSDALIGQRAVDAGLCSGVSTLDAVVEYALTRAATQTERKNMADATEPVEGEKAQDPPADDPMKCAKCEAMNPIGSKFCNACGSSLAAAEPMPEEDPMSESEPEPGAKASRAAPRMSADADLVSILGASGDSLPALKSAAIKMRASLDAVAKLVGARGHLDSDGIIEGVALAIDDRNEARTAAKAWRTKAESEQARSDERERMDMLADLERIGAYKAGELFAHDRKDGKIVGKRPAIEWSADVAKGGRSLANLRVHWAAKMAAAKDKPAAQRNPFEPKAAPKGDASTVEITEEDRRLAARSGLPAEQLARSRVALSQNGEAR